MITVLTINASANIDYNHDCDHNFHYDYYNHHYYYYIPTILIAMITIATTSTTAATSTTTIASAGADYTATGMTMATECSAVVWCRDRGALPGW